MASILFVAIVILVTALVAIILNDVAPSAFEDNDGFLLLASC